MKESKTLGPLKRQPSGSALRELSIKNGNNPKILQEIQEQLKEV